MLTGPRSHWKLYSQGENSTWIFHVSSQLPIQYTVPSCLSFILILIHLILCGNSFELKGSCKVILWISRNKFTKETAGSLSLDSFQNGIGHHLPALVVSLEFINHVCSGSEQNNCFHMTAGWIAKTISEKDYWAMFSTILELIIISWEEGVKTGHLWLHTNLNA